MFEFKYDIKYDGDDMPYISLPDDFESTPEHSFMIIQLSTYIINNLIELSKKRGDPAMILENLEELYMFLEKLNNNMSLTLSKQKIELDNLINNTEDKSNG